MLTAISRYGARVLPNTEELVAGCKARGEFIQGPQIADSKPRSQAGRRTGARDRGGLRPHGLLLHAEGARPAAGIRDHFAGADLLGRAGARARRRA